VQLSRVAVPLSCDRDVRLEMWGAGGVVRTSRVAPADCGDLCDRWWKGCRLKVQFFSQADRSMGGCNVILRLSAPKLVH
jgi:hypothetical protein